MSLIKEAAKEVVDEKRLTIISRHKELLLNILLIGCVMWLVIYSLNDKDRQIDKERKDKETYKELLEISIEVDKNVHLMNEIRSKLKEDLNPTTKKNKYNEQD